MWTAATALDYGACCESKINFALLAGATGLTGVNTGSTWTPTNTNSKSPGISGNGVSCPAFSALSGTLLANSGAAMFGPAAFDIDATAYSSWWCSNGLYKNVLTAGSTANTTTVTSNNVQMF